MACIDVDALAQYESDAKLGRADALYNLGLAYSTGQGVGIDLIAAHKWFNLAAIAEAQRLAREWLSISR
jgi:TPR repeat protein